MDKGDNRTPQERSTEEKYQEEVAFYMKQAAEYKDKYLKNSYEGYQLLEKENEELKETLRNIAKLINKHKW
jgi:hypothetical protein